MSIGAAAGERDCLTNLAKARKVQLMGRSFSIGEAKTHLSKLIAMVERGERVELRRGREPVALIVPAPAQREPRREPGALRGQITLDEDFDIWPDDVAASLGTSD